MKEYKEKIENTDPEKIVYADEPGIDECLHREYGYAPRGEKVMESIPGKKFRRTNIVAAQMGCQINSKERLNLTAEKYHKKIMFLPPCSPELNPTENFWHTLKHWIRMHIHEYDSLDGAIAAAFHVF